MAGPTTISEALQTLPSSSTSFTASSSTRQTSSSRRLLVTKKRFPSSADAETHQPTKLQWIPHRSHLLAHGTDGGPRRRRDGKVKEALLITGRDSGVKQSLKFNCSLPLPFLEQNGPHDEDHPMDLDEDPVGNQDAHEGVGLTASDLEMDLESNENDRNGRAGLTADFLEDLESESPPPATSKLKSKSPSHIAKRRRIDSKGAKEEEQERYDSLPLDFLQLLSSEIPGGRKSVSPGDFARVWKLSGRKMGNEMVLAQNEYFTNNDATISDARHKRKEKSRKR
ncbi:hypothetical protein ABW20_dc0104465 [Dactylellina cionopaga]|nr:hypothetical protein ABW20_dc0104465 [Dactylellina cionopaga]